MAREQRRLAAILAADVVGYSRLMGHDESGTLAALKAHRTELIDPLIGEHGGRMFKTMGDGLLIEFASIVDATRCAMRVQEGMLNRNAAVEPERRISFRMGINLGDVIVDGDDVFGDGVNIAARLEPLARAGGLCLSGKARDELRGKLDIDCVDGGEQALKNIALPVRVYHWTSGGTDAAPFPKSSSQASSALSASDRLPSVRLMALEAGTASEQDRSLANSITEEIALPLANLTGIRLVSNDGAADYLVKGRLQVAANRARVTITVLDHASGQQFWSERFDADLSDLFSALDEFALRISTALRFEIYAREAGKLHGREDAALSDEERKAQAGMMLLGSRRADYQRSKALIDPLVARRPDDFMALGIRAAASTEEAICGWREIAPDDGRLALDLARRALAINERSDFLHAVLGSIHLYFERDVAAASREADRALELNSHYVLAMDLLGLSRIFSGDPAGGIALCRKAVEVGPRFPARSWLMQDVALGHFVLGDDTGAIEWCRRADQRERDVPRCLLILIAAAARSGDNNLVEAESARLLGAAPDFSLGRMRRWPFGDDEPWRALTEALRKAGLPG